eukprot:2810439-Alexandrium_andersonii.AAC.1
MLLDLKPAGGALRDVEDPLLPSDHVPIVISFAKGGLDGDTRRIPEWVARHPRFKQIVARLADEHLQEGEPGGRQMNESMLQVTC